MKTKHSLNTISETNPESKSYSVIIDTFRKGNYKIYSYRMQNNSFEAIKFSVNKKDETIISKSLTTSEVNEFEQYISSFPLEELEENYINEKVRGEYHLIYQITIGKKHKSIYVYFERQNYLVELYEKLRKFIPVNKGLKYY